MAAPEHLRPYCQLLSVCEHAQAALIDATLGPLTPDQISIWRHTSIYPATPLPVTDPNAATPEFAAQMAAAAVQLAATAICPAVGQTTCRAQPAVYAAGRSPVARGRVASHSSISDVGQRTARRSMRIGSGKQN